MQDYTLVFDLDGTIIDTAPDLIRAVNHVVAGEGLEPLDPGDIKNAIGHGARHMIVAALAMRGITRSEADIDHMLDRFLVFYADNIAIESRPFPFLLETLDQLAASGVRLAVCTNKREDLSRRLLDALGLTDRFCAIAGRDTFAVCKPHPEHLVGTIRLAGGDIERAIMIGDSDTDIRTARAAGVPVIAVTFGYSSVPVASLNPDAVIDHYGEFRGALARVLPRF